MSAFALAARLVRAVRVRLEDLAATLAVDAHALVARRPLVAEDGYGIVTYTSHGERASKAWRAAVSIGRGAQRPSRLILWLEPRDLAAATGRRWDRLRGLGLEVREARPGLGPHTKYFGALELSVASGEPIVTADDDVIYPRRWLAALRGAQEAEPGRLVVSCFRARVMPADGGRAARYDAWPLATRATLAEDLFLTGVSGAVYPSAFAALALSRGTEFLDLCARADDVWLNRLARDGGFAIRLVDGVSVDFAAVIGTRNTGLSRRNVVGDENTAQIERTFSGMAGWPR
ncbi:hypothetical protein [Demequina mangrovi]|uniref:Glycosyl transferase family 2 n=1 Tax=Demequina mangrovi TaxID=1043493 RepID=A0A1H6YW48_9MICO|nr:hypothetical protein [Demequina mangrovi]SEJ41005.1 hypothetical protein SAMN05421637_1757 [Demequina mangrovi]